MITGSLRRSKYIIANVDRREEIIDLLKHRFAEKMKANLPVFGIEKNSLTDFTTTEKDMKRYTSRFPPSHFRIKSEDILAEGSTHMSIGGKQGDSEVVDNTFALMDDLQKNVEIRNKQF